MSFSSDKQSSKSTKTTQAPPSFLSEYGNLSYNKKRNTYGYDVTQPESMVQARATTENKLNDILSGIPTSFGVDDMYNNPFYDTYKGYLYQPLQQQQQQDQKTLRDQLSAQNQLGSSYDAYQNYLQNKQYTDAYSQAENQARLGSADAYTQALNNQLGVLSGLRNDYGQQLNAYYAPANLALGYTNAFAPYAATTVTGSQTSDPSFLTRYNQYMQTNAQMAGTVAKAMAGA